MTFLCVYLSINSTALCAGNQEGQYRLVHSFSPYNGSLEVCGDGGWKPVCGSEQQDEVVLGTVCYELGFSRGNIFDVILNYVQASPYTNLESGIISYSLKEGDGYCCLTNRTDATTCEQCGSSCNHRIQIECETCQQVTQQQTLSECPTPQPSPTVMCSGCSQAIQHTVTVEHCQSTPTGLCMGSSQVIQYTVTVKHCPSSITVETQSSSHQLSETSTVRSMHISDRPLEKTTPDSRGSAVPLLTMNTRQGGSLSLNGTECSDGIITPLGAVSGILGALLVAAVVGWIVTCVVYSKKSTTLKRRMFLK